ncbi:hypothetical protein MC885_017515 [Smutsia gigantea]|nr:hypothetical protein MC885_017515 [Smutsia gigantea]
MSILKLPLVLTVFSVALNHLKATPMESHQVEKRKCNTATCATQRLANFLVRSGNNLGAVLPPTNAQRPDYPIDITESENLRTIH